MTKIQTFTFSPYYTNCYVCHSEGEAVIVDASCSELWEEQQLVDYITRNNLTVRHLLLTHAHIDHIFGCAALARRFGIAWTAHKDSMLLIRLAHEQSLMFNTQLEQPPSPEIWVDEGDTIKFGDAEWSVLHTPGHAPGSICFLDMASGFVMAGDVLFHQSIGRTDLPGGDMPTLMASIFQKLSVLPEHTKVYSGHGQATTIGYEKQHNPFLQ